MDEQKTIMGIDGQIFLGDEAGKPIVDLKAATEIDDVVSVSIKMDTDLADVTTRRGKGWRSYQQSLRDVSIEIVMPVDGGSFEKFLEAYNGKAALPLLVADGDGGGIEADFNVANISEEQPLGDMMVATVSLSFSLDEREPAWVEIDEGEPGEGEED